MEEYEQLVGAVWQSQLPVQGKKLLPHCELLTMAAAGLVNSPSGSIPVDTRPKTAQENYLVTNIIKGAVGQRQAFHKKDGKDSLYSVNLHKAIGDQHDELDESLRCVNMYNIPFQLDHLLDNENKDAIYGPLVSGADEGPPWEESPEEAHEPADAQVVPVFDPILHLLNALPKPTKEMILSRLVE